MLVFCIGSSFRALSLAVLFISVVAFALAFVTVLSDHRRSLVPAARLYHPSFVYAFFAIPLQAGVVQVRSRF
jgi:hypothetical protein